MLIWGTKFFGHVDSTDNNIYVATRFHHCCLIPLVYQGSYIVADDTYALRISVNLKSIFFAYFRTALGIASIVAALSLILVISDWTWNSEHIEIASVALASLIIFIGIGFYSFKWTRADADKKLKLLDRLKRDQARLITLTPPHVEIN